MDDNELHALLDDLQPAPQSSLQFDTSGFPAGDVGRHVAAGLLLNLNEHLEQAGWDQPQSVWAVGSPAHGAAVLAEHDLHPDDIAADLPDHDDGDSITTAYPMGVLATFVGDPFEQLPRVKVPPAVIAVVHAYEAWTSPNLQMRPSEDPNHDEHRYMHFVARSGLTLTLDAPRGAPPTIGDTHSGLIAAFGARLVGHDLVTSPLTVADYFGHLCWGAAATVLTGPPAGPDITWDQTTGALGALGAALATAATLIEQATLDGATLDASDLTLVRYLRHNPTHAAARFLGPGRDTTPILDMLSSTVRDLTFTALATTATFTHWPPGVDSALVKFAGDQLTGALLERHELRATQHARDAVAERSPRGARHLDKLLSAVGWNAGVHPDRTPGT